MQTKILKLSFWLIPIIVLTFLFQAGHFIEHLAQFGAWLFGAKDSMFMTPWAIGLVEWLGGFFPNEETFQARRIGMELLHLIGNTIFFIGICAFYYFNKSRAVKIAFWFQLVHVLEHLALTVTIFTVGYPIGISTLFGMQTSVKAFIGYRVIWHFIINLIPSFYIVKALVQKKR